MSNDATVKFGYDGTALNAGLRTQDSQLKRFASGTASHFSRLTSSINGHLGKIGAGIGVTALARFTKSALEDFDAIAAGSQKLNTSAETYQRLGKAAQVLGNTDIETLSGALIRLRRQLIDDPTGEMAQGLEEIGFKTKDFLRLDADAQMLALADAFQSAEAGGRQLPVLTKALGKNFAELIPLLSNGRDSMKQFMDESVVASNAAVAAADEINDRYDAMAGKIGTVAKSLAVATAQGIGEMIGLMPRTEIDADGSKRRAKDAEREAELQNKRDAEAQAAATAEARAMREKSAAQNLELEKKRSSIALSRLEVEMLEMQAKGQDRKLKKMQEQQFIEKRAHEFSAQGLDANASIKLAQREWDAQQRIDQQKRTGRSHIGGVGESRLMGGGLDQFKRNQIHHETAAGAPNKPGYARGAYTATHNAFDVSLTSAQRTGRMMGGGTGASLSGRDARGLSQRDLAAAAQQQQQPRAAETVADLGKKLDETNRILKEGILDQ